MAFTDTIQSIPFVARTTTGRGFLPPLLRAMGHLLYLLGNVADEAVTVTDEQALTELRHAMEHWDARTATENVSTAAADRATVIRNAINEAITEWPEWTPENRTQNLRDLVHRILQYAADLDRELVGITTSDPGSTL